MSASVKRRLSAAAEAAHAMTDTFFESAELGRRSRPLEDAVSRPEQLGVPVSAAASRARARRPLLNARVAISERHGSALDAARAEYGQIALEGHLSVLQGAMQVLQDWNQHLSPLAAPAQPAPGDLRRLSGALQRHHSDVRGRLDAAENDRINELSGAMAVVQVAGEEHQETYRCAAAYLALCLTTPENALAREFAASQSGGSLRRALATQAAPAGWTQSAVDPAATFEGETLAAHALKVALTSSAGTFADRGRYEKLPTGTRDDALVRNWVIYEAKSGEARAFFAQNTRDSSWALLAYIPQHVSCGGGRTYTDVYNKDIILPALRRLF